MKFPCPNCDHITSGDVAPRFCSQCGYRFNSADAATVPPQPVTSQLASDQTDAPTIPPGGPGPALAPRRQLEQLPGFEIVRELGRGGMGVVYEAVEQQSGRSVALKLLSSGIDHSTETVKRFLQEGQIAASLSHPRTTFVYDAGELDGRFFITMELMPGGTIKDVIDRRGKLPVADAVNYTLDMLDGLEAAHAIDVVHRDVKPSNCFVTSDDRVKVGDFGISKSLVTDASLTMTGSFMGTPQFAAPEQIRAVDIDGRTDIYSAGATLFYMLTGRAPFQGDAIQVVADIASETPPTLISVDEEIPRGLSQIVARVLEKDPNKRPQSIAELREVLLPYSDRGSTISDVGRRMAAFFIDVALVSFIATPLHWVLLGLFQSGAWVAAEPGVNSWIFGTISVLYFSVYFATCEWWWGRGVGKWLMGLRVVNERGERPGLVPVFLRSLLVPGVANTVRSLGPVLIFSLMGWDPGTAGPTTSSGMLISGLVPIAAALAGFLMMSSMRERNGLRGLHELVTGTQTIRAAVATVRQITPLTLAEVVDGEPIPPQYELGGLLHETAERTVFTAIDKALQRPVWLVRTAADAAAVSASRAGAARPTRPHLLRSEIIEYHRWDAFEAIQGAPFLDAVSEDGTRLPWPTAQQALADLATELVAAEADGTIPNQLYESQVWIDSSGRAKLLDFPLEHGPGGILASSGYDLICRLLERSRHLLPAEGLDLLSRARETQMSVEEVQAGLANLGDRSGRMTWDERLGVLAISFGTEVSLIATGLSLLCLLTNSFFGSPILLSVAAAAVPFVVGWAFRGGLVFRIARVEVRRNGLPASPLRCAIRNLLAWGTATTGLGWFSYSITSMFFSQDPNVVNSLLLILAVGLLVCFALGSLVNLLLPRRGLQDLIAGTELVAK